MSTVRDWTAIGGAVIIAALVAVAAGDGTARVGHVPLVGICFFLAFTIQWVGFMLAWPLRTESFFDLAGSVAFLLVGALALATTGLATTGLPDARAVVIALLVGVWAIRLGAFLSMRIRSDGFDRRFDAIKSSFSAFLMTWMLQGLWVSLTFAPGLAAITVSSPVAADMYLAAGCVLWAVGFAIEVAADAQKRRFRARPENAGRFIASGLWAWCRHPNYFGEILLWIGIAVAAWPVLSGWAHLTLISPVFVWLLVTRISGVPMLEATARERWGEDADYLAYRSRTPRIVPVPPRWRRARDT